MRTRRFMSYNVCGSELRTKKKLLVASACLEDECPNLLAEYEGSHLILTVCLEEFHMNMVVSKLAGCLARCPPDELTVMAVEGSPHCVQLLYSIEEALKIVGKRTRVRYLVVNKCEIREVNPEVVKLSRYPSKIAKLIKREALDPSERGRVTRG